MRTRHRTMAITGTHLSRSHRIVRVCRKAERGEQAGQGGENWATKEAETLTDRLGGVHGRSVLALYKKTDRASHKKIHY